MVDKGENAVAMIGFEELNRALARISGGVGNFGVAYEVQERLRKIGETVAAAAPQFVTHKTGRHGDPQEPRLEDSVRVAVTAKAATVYSTAIYGGVQNYGGGPHAGWGARGPHVKQRDASRWMSRAVASQRQYVKDELDGLLDWVVAEFEHDGI